MGQAISLFSGCGGCSLGLKQAGFEVKLAVDIDENACQTYAFNFVGDRVLKADLSQLQPTEILKHSGITRSQLDLIVGGPPCQGFSSAGAKNWADPRNILLRQFVEIVISLKPKWFIMENVEGLLTSKEGFYLIEAITRFLDAGYWVRTEKVYMNKYGLPQKRKRVFVVGNLEQCVFDFPPSSYANDSQLSLFQELPELSIIDAIGDLPYPSESGIINYEQKAFCDYQVKMRRKDDKPIQHHQIKSLNSLSQERINLLTPGATMKDLPPHLQHISYSRRALRRVMDGTPTEKRGGAPNGLKRLLASEPSLTITSAAASEFVHPRENRLLTLRECARLQSFPDWYEFQGSWSSISRQIANAIPPLFMELLATHIRKIATGKPCFDFPGRWLGINASNSNGKSPKLAKMLEEIEKKTYTYAR